MIASKTPAPQEYRLLDLRSTSRESAGRTHNKSRICHRQRAIEHAAAQGTHSVKLTETSPSFL